MQHMQGPAVHASRRGAQLVVGGLVHNAARIRHKLLPAQVLEHRPRPQEAVGFRSQTEFRAAIKKGGRRSTGLHSTQRPGNTLGQVWVEERIVAKALRARAALASDQRRGEWGVHENGFLP